MKIKIIDPTADNRWDEFLAGQQHSTIFHTSAWAKAISGAYSYLPRYYVLEKETGQFAAGAPFYLIRSRLTGRRLVCLPFSDYCCPLGDDPADIALLLDAAKKDVASGVASHLEIRGWQHKLPSNELGLLPRHYHLSYVIDLEPDAERLKSKFHDSVRRCINQSVKQDMTVRPARSENDLKAFYRLNVSTRKKLGVLPQPYTFFQSIYRHVLSRGLGFIMMVECEERVIAAVLFLTYRDTIYYKFNASDTNYLRKRPNHLLIWEAIKYACSDGYNYFDFGRCSPEEEGLRTFKRRWLAKEADSPYYYYPEIRGLTTISENSLKYRSMKLLSHMMPYFAFRIAGSALYRHLG